MPAQKKKTTELSQNDTTVVVPLVSKPDDTDPPVAPNLESILEENDEVAPLEQKNTVLFSIGLVITAIIIVIVMSVSLVYLRSSQTMPAKKEVVSAAMTPTPTPAFAPVTFAVLNASGVTGAAGKAAQQLASKGYVVVSVGNAKQSATTKLYFSSSLSSQVQAQILGDAAALFSVATNSGDLTGSTAAAELIVGVK